MRKLLVGFILAFSIGIIALPVNSKEKCEFKDTVEAVEDLYNTSCAILNHDGSKGSGVVIIRNNNGYVLTDAHVIQSNKVFAEDGSIIFYNTKIVQKVYKDEEEVVFEDSAGILTYNSGIDFAILKLKNPPTNYKNTEFITSVPKQGTPIVHIGNYGKINNLPGEYVNDGHLISTIGTYSALNRTSRWGKMDFITLNYAVPGCSGGGVFNDEKKCVGLIVAQYTDQAFLINPIRKLKKWTDTNSLEWIFDKKAKVPTEEELKKIPTEVGEILRIDP